jgi:hypothetical protein
MNPLTVQHAIDNQFRGIDLVKYFKPDLSDEECDYILWQKTCFPMSLKRTIEQLNEMFLAPRVRD